MWGIYGTSREDENIVKIQSTIGSQHCNNKQLFKDGGPGEIALKRMHDLARLEYIEDRTKAVHEGHLGLQLQGQQGLQAQGQAEAEENAKIQDIVKAVRVVETLHNDGVRWSPESDKGMNTRKKKKFKNLNLKLSGTSKGTRYELRRRRPYQTETSKINVLNGSITCTTLVDDDKIDKDELETADIDLISTDAESAEKSAKLKSTDGDIAKPDETDLEDQQIPNHLLGKGENGSNSSILKSSFDLAANAVTKLLNQVWRLKNVFT